jgi:hypothetical protein
MPALRMVIWNIENLGLQTSYRSAWPQLATFIANVVLNVEADVVLIEELRSVGIGNQILHHIQQVLNTLPAPHDNWYFDWIKGSIAPSPAGVAPYATSADLDWDSAHYEGYAVFWNQNISRFRLSPAPPIQPPGHPLTPNSQSETARIQGQVAFGFGGAVVPMPGWAVPVGGIVTPGGATPYVLPAGTIVPPAAALLVATPTAAGTVLPVGTVIGAGGVTLNGVMVGNVEPRVIPGGYTLTDALPLPPTGTVLVPEHAMSLVMFGRSTGNPPANLNGDISAGVANFNPLGGTPFDWLYFTRGAGFPAGLKQARRPAYITLDVNRAPPNNGPADRLVPVIVYHAPSAGPASNSGMQRASYSQPLYQAYDWAAGAWINCNNALLGGDFNVATDEVAYAYNAFFHGFGAGGANCNAMIYHPPPPPPPPGQTRRDNPLNKSMVEITDFFGAPIFSANFDDYRTLAIDNVFFRGFGGAPPCMLYDLLEAVTGGGPLHGAIAPGVITGFLHGVPLFAAIHAAIFGAGGALLPPTPSINAPAWTVSDLAAGVFGAAGVGGTNTMARRAAEFVHLCVSDHLPVGFELPL